MKEIKCWFKECSHYFEDIKDGCGKSLCSVKDCDIFNNDDIKRVYRKSRMYDAVASFINKQRL